MPARLLIVITITLVGLAVRLYHLDFQSLWRDEVDVLMFSSRDLSELLHNFLKQGENGPLYYVLHHYWLAAVGNSEIALRLPSALFGVAAIPVVYGIGRELLDTKSALLGALITALSPYYIWYSQDAKMYSLLLFLTSLSFLLYLRALHYGNVASWIGYVAVTTLSLYVHFFAALVVLTQVVIYFGFFRNCYRGYWTVSIGFLTLPYLPLAVWQFPVLISPPETAYPSLGPSGVATVLLVLFVTGQLSIPPAIPLVLAVFLLLASIFYCGYRYPEVTNETLRTLSSKSGQGLGQSNGTSLLLVWLLIPIVAFLLVSMRMPLFTDRYLIIVTPAFVLLVASGLIALQRRWRVAFRIALPIWFGIALYSVVWQAHTQLKSDFRSAAAIFARDARSDDLVIFNMPYVQHTFRYYYPSPIRLMNAPYTNDGRAPDPIERLMLSQAGRYSTVWLVSSEEEQWDARGLGREWLQTNLTLVQSWDGVGVRLEQYRSQQ